MPELCCSEGTKLPMALSLSAKKLIRKIPHTIALIPRTLVVGFGGAPLLSAGANREWFPLSLASVPGPVNQVHKPKLLGEVLLLNSSQLLEFFFPLALLIGKSWVFPWSWFARERKKRSKRLLHRRRGALKKCFVISPYILHSSPCSVSMRSPAKTCLCHSDLRWKKVEQGICLALAQITTTPPLIFGLLVIALCALLKHTRPELKGKSGYLRVKDSLACGRTTIVVLNLCLWKMPSKQQGKEFCFSFCSFVFAGHP